MNRFDKNFQNMEQIVVPRNLGDRLVIASGFLSIGSGLYFIRLCIYRIVFHPLAKFPGPWINAIPDVKVSDCTRKAWTDVLIDSWCDRDSAGSNADEYEKTPRQIWIRSPPQSK